MKLVDVDKLERTELELHDGTRVKVILEHTIDEAKRINATVLDPASYWIDCGFYYQCNICNCFHGANTEYCPFCGSKKHFDT